MSVARVGLLGEAGVVTEAAISGFYLQGYHGTSVRKIAESAGLSVAGIYHHVESKQVLLFSIIHSTMVELFESGEHAVAACISEPPLEQLLALVRAHVLFHCFRRRESFIVLAETRSLEDIYRKQVLVMRRKHQESFDRLIMELHEGLVDANTAKLTALALVTMCNDVARWFTPDEVYGPVEVADHYCLLATRLVGKACQPQES